MQRFPTLAFLLIVVFTVLTRCAQNKPSIQQKSIQNPQEQELNPQPLPPGIVAEIEAGADHDLTALGDIAMNGQFGPRCVYCPLYIPQCRCPPFYRCVFVMRTCFRCASWRCVPRWSWPTLPFTPIPLPTNIIREQQ